MWHPTLVEKESLLRDVLAFLCEIVQLLRSPSSFWAINNWLNERKYGKIEQLKARKIRKFSTESTADAKRARFPFFAF